MNRRNFLARIAAVPFLGGAVKLLAERPVNPTKQYIAKQRPRILAGQLVYWDGGDWMPCECGTPGPSAVALAHGDGSGRLPVYSFGECNTEQL